MLKAAISLQNALGLHTRAAAKLVALASQFASQIEITYKEETINCKSIMALIMLGAKKNTVLNFSISGEDELIAMEKIKELINNRFGEKI